MDEDAVPSGCDAADCDRPAVGSYLYARDACLVEFSICTDHHARLQNGERPVVVTDRFGRAPRDGSPALLFED